MSVDSAAGADAVARQAAATLVDAAATPGWSDVRQGFVTLFRSSADTEADADSLTRRLDGMAEKVEQAPGTDRDRVRAELAGSWRTRLADFLEDHPEAAASLAALLPAQGGGVTSGAIHAQSYDQSTMIIAPGGTVNLGGDRISGR